MINGGARVGMSIIETYITNVEYKTKRRRLVQSTCWLRSLVLNGERERQRDKLIVVGTNVNDQRILGSVS